MVVSPLDILTVDWSENGVVKVRQLGKSVLSTSTAWATVAFLFQEADGAGGWRAPKVSIRRYRKRGKTYVVDKHLTLSTAKQAGELASAIGAWFAPGGPGVVDVANQSAGAAAADDDDDE